MGLTWMTSLLGCSCGEGAGTAPEDSKSEAGSPSELASGETGQLAGSGQTGDTGMAAPWDGTYLGTVEVEVRIVPYGGSPPIEDTCIGPLSLVIHAAESPSLQGSLECTFVAAGVTAPGSLRGGLLDPQVEGWIVIGGTEPGETPVVDGPWEGEIVLDSQSGLPVVQASFTGGFFTAGGSEVDWQGTFLATREGG
jgi:hypothetical protein